MGWMMKSVAKLCPVCGDKVTLIGKTKDGRVIGSCQDAFDLDEWMHDDDPVEASVCSTCRYAKRQPGDWVPYGSTMTQFPDDLECTRVMSDKESELYDQLVGEDLMCPGVDEEHPCPFWEVVKFRCEKHGTVHGLDYCPRCDDELWK